MPIPFISFTDMLPSSIPIISIQNLKEGKTDAEAARKISEACRQHGFFYVIDHGVSTALQEKLERESHAFFSLPESEKMKISMDKAGKAWRGFFPVGGELTSGKPDIKEGIYFGQELNEEHPKVKAGIPLHGANLFPEQPVGIGNTVLEYMTEVTKTGHAILRGIALSLGLEMNYFEERYTADPLILFRIFHYPPPTRNQQDFWGVGEHTDYGLLTILKQDKVGGLQVKTPGGWTDAPPLKNTFICNIGDMLDRMTGGLYRSTPHRVLNESAKSRYSFPLFFDPAFDAPVHRIENIDATPDDQQERWDKASVHTFEGIYGDYLLGKVGKVFPDLKNRIG